MPIMNNGKEYYPLDFGKMVKDSKTYYDRSNREKSYFYLALLGAAQAQETPAPSNT